MPRIHMTSDPDHIPQPCPRAFDARVLCEMFGAESGVVAAVLETFLASIADSMRDLQAARDVGDMVAMEAMAHRIKGAAGMSGALALARIAVCLEGLARDGDWALMRALMAQLETQWLLLQQDPDLRRMASIAP